MATESADTFVDGVATRIPDPVAIALICAGAARIIAVPDDDVREAMRDHAPLHPLGRRAVGGAGPRRRPGRARRCWPAGASAVIHSGANADAALVASVLRG